VRCGFLDQYCIDDDTCTTAWEQIKADIYALEAPFWERQPRCADVMEIKISAIAKRMGKWITKGGKLKRITGAMSW